MTTRATHLQPEKLKMHLYLQSQEPIADLITAVNNAQREVIKEPHRRQHVKNMSHATRLQELWAKTSRRHPAAAQPALATVVQMPSKAIAAPATGSGEMTADEFDRMRAILGTKFPAGLYLVEVK